MKFLKLLIWTGACALCCVACSTGIDSDNGWTNDWGGTTGGTNGSNGTNGTDTGGSAGADSSGNLLQDLAISWDDVSDTGFTDAVETIPTNSDDDEYEDYVENATFSSQISIAWSGSSASVSGSVSGVTVTQSGGHVTVNSTVAGVEYILSGTATDGSLKVYSDKKFKLTLNGVSLTSTKGAAINIQADKRAYVVVTAGTTNTLTDAASYSDTTDGEDEKACLFSEGKLLFSGSGSLTVNGNYKHAICSDDYVRLRSGGHITVTSAAKDGIHANDRIIMGGGLLKLTPSADGMECEEGDIEIRGGLLKADITGTASRALKAATDVTVSGGQLILLTSGGAEYDSDEKDVDSAGGIKCDGNMTITNASVSAKSTGSGGKGLKCDGAMTITGSTVKVITTGKKYTYSSNLDSSPKGIKAGGNLTMTDSTIEVSTSGGDGSEGIESKATMTVNSGTVCVYAYDDCMNATSNITVNGGSVYCYSSGNDGIDSNGTLTFTGGTVVSSGTTSPEEGIDCDTNTFKITGGTILGIGGGTSSPTTSVCTQYSMVYGGSGNSGTRFTVTTSGGELVMSYEIPRTYNSMTILFSSDKLTSGGSYVVYTGGSVSGDSFYGLTTNGTYTAGTQSTTFTVNSLITSVGNVSTGGPGTTGGGGNTPGGMGGGWRW